MVLRIALTWRPASQTTECKALAAAGAKWIGPAVQVPVSRPYIERIRVRDFRCIKRQTMRSLIGPVRLLRLDPDGMRQPTNLISQGSPLEYGPRGEGLAAVYDAFLSRQLPVFLDISKRFTELFPTARAIQLTNPSQTTKALGVELMDGGSVGADRLSEGMLYWLAFAALPYLHPTPLILIEEPENGLHPSRIGDVMRVLREVAKTSQIILATHHPLVINELQADEVTIDAIGGVAKPAIEGWILALRAVPRTDEMSRARTLAHLAEHGIGIKSTADYVDIVEQAELGEPRHFGLPAGTESLRAWLATAHEVLTHLVHGRPAP